MVYTNLELTDMVLMYGRAMGNAREAQRLYQETFPGRAVPDHHTFTATVQRLRETGTFRPQTVNRGRQRTARVLDAEPEILNIVEENPSISVRRLSYRVGVSPFIVWRTLKEQGLHPYHLQRVQALKQEDLPRRVRFCEWLLERNDQDPQFVENLLSTDEATFTRDGVFNSRNTHIWCDENPHAIHEGRFQERFSVNVWAGMVGNYLVGPYVLPPRLTGDAYLNFLRTDFENFLDDVPLATRRNMWYLHDGAPAHHTRDVREWLNEAFPRKWIGRNGPVSWPPRSPDLNSCDFFLWGHMKQLVYATPVNSVEELTQRIFNVAAAIRANQNMLRRVQGSLIRRARACIENDGRHFEQLL